MIIKNIVFDVGNVLVKWDPASVIARVFPNENQDQLTKAIFKSELWFAASNFRILLNVSMS